MGKQTYPKSFRLTATALARLEAYCEISGLDASEVARAAIAQFIAPALQGVSIDTKEEKATGSSDSDGQERQEFFKEFWGEVKDRQFPKRVIKTIKDHWKDLKELDADNLGRMYNEYCEAEELAGRTYCHPNSWLANGGYENESSKKQDGGIAWDVE